jgi:alkyl hydroperoxide reductase subunit D
VASAIASRNLAFTRALEGAAAGHLDAAHLQAARAAAAIMGMNNIYYRFLHLVEDAEYQAMPARLRMNILANPGIDKLDFELLSLAVSAVNGCGLCITSHEKKLRAHGYTREMIQSAVRIAATVHAVAGVLEYSEAGGAAVADAQAA